MLSRAVFRGRQHFHRVRHETSERNRSGFRLRLNIELNPAVTIRFAGHA